MKKHILLKSTILLPLLGSVLSGCGFKKNNFAYDLDFNVDVSGQKITLWNPFGSDISDVLTEICEEFTRLTKVQVNVEDKTGYDTLEKAVSRSATSGKYPNIVFGYPDHFASYVKSDIIVRLDYYFENNVHNSTFEPDGVDFKKEDFYADYMRENESIEFDENGKGYTLGVPFNKSTEVLIYNKTFFDYCATQATLKDKVYVPKSYDELESVGTAILKYFKDNDLYGKVLFSDGTTGNREDSTKKAVINLMGIYEAGSEGTDSTKWFKPFSYDSQSNLFITTVRQNGGTYTSFDKTTNKGYVEFNSKETVDGLTKIKSLYDKNIFGIPADWGEAKYGSNPFKACKTVMTVGSSAGVANSAPTGNKFDIAAAPILYFNENNKYVISQGTNLALLDKGSRAERVASWELLKFLTKYANGYFCSRTSYYPASEYSELPLPGQTTSGMWNNYDDEVFIDYATWRNEAGESFSTADRIKSQTASVNINEYVNKTIAKPWTKFVDQAFAGSSDIRDAVASIPAYIFTGEYTVQGAIDHVYDVLADYVRK